MLALSLLKSTKQSGKGFHQELAHNLLEYSRRQYKVSVPLKKNHCPTACQRLKKRNRFYGVYMLTIFTRQIHQQRAEVIDDLERNWREEKRLIDQKSINNRRTEAEHRLEEQKQTTD